MNTESPQQDKNKQSAQGDEATTPTPPAENMVPPTKPTSSDAPKSLCGYLMKQSLKLPIKTWKPKCGSVVRLSNYGHAEAVITGIDQYGYLLVRRREDRQELSLQPDGNSFDIMRGLIAMKTNS
ncbi:uncharacterized protein LOC135345074 [Halichondria panicea]|uniref:uncharacterized protein LOC135345074 n=1 Tax=Halichondria panicea TaxID=6063 RepID=UPI00312BC35E